MPPRSPDAAARDHAGAALDAASRTALMRGGSKTFFAASLLLPARVRAPATALYAFCRLADDAVDLEDDASAALDGLYRRLDRIYAGRPLPVDADQALAEVVERCEIPYALPAALLEGFQWDAQGRRYETIEALHEYAARVAGTVGAMMALIMGAHGARALARACELGVAMQLTNIARDVGEDARAGRLYLPRAWMHEAGIDPDGWLRAPAFDDALASVVARVLAAADDLYLRAADGLAELPRGCRPAIQAARLVYAEIGREVERAGTRLRFGPRRRLAQAQARAGGTIAGRVSFRAADAGRAGADRRGAISGRSRRCVTRTGVALRCAGPALLASARGVDYRPVRAACGARSAVKFDARQGRSRGCERAFLSRRRVQRPRVSACEACGRAASTARP